MRSEFESVDMSLGLFRAQPNWQGEAWDFFDAEGEHESVFVFDSVVAVEEADGADKGVEIVVEGVLLEFHGGVGEFESVAGSDAPVRVDAPEGVEFDSIGVAEDGVIFEVSVAEVEFEI